MMTQPILPLFFLLHQSMAWVVQSLLSRIGFMLRPLESQYLFFSHHNFQFLEYHSSQQIA